MRRKIKIILALLAVALGCLPFLFPLMGKVSHSAVVKRELLCRTKSLKIWKEMIEQYQIIHKILPPDLYQVVKEIVDLPSAKVGVIFNEPIEKYLSDPDYFFEHVEYRFYSNKNDWVIVESSPGKYKTNYFMINNKGNMYEVKEYKCEK